MENEIINQSKNADCIGSHHKQTVWWIFTCRVYKTKKSMQLMKSISTVSLKNDTFKWPMITAFSSTSMIHLLYVKTSHLRTLIINPVKYNEKQILSLYFLKCTSHLFASHFHKVLFYWEQKFDLSQCSKPWSECHLVQSPGFCRSSATQSSFISSSIPMNLHFDSLKITASSMLI